MKMGINIYYIYYILYVVISNINMSILYKIDILRYKIYLIIINYFFLAAFTFDLEFFCKALQEEFKGLLPKELLK